MQLKHLPYLFVAVAALCLTGAVAASANAAEDEPAHVSARR